jgi:ABC-2 type transport system permease protein
MSNAIRVELLKLRTTRLTYGLLLTGAAITALFTILEGALGGTGTSGPKPLYTASGFTDVFSGGIWLLLFAAVAGVTVTTAEYRHHTATLSYLADANRNRVLGAKVAAGALTGLIFGLAAVLVAGGTAVGFTLAKGYQLPLSDATMARYAAGTLLAGALLSAIGTGTGALVRSQLAGIVSVFVWTIVVESLIGGLFTGTRPYLPYTAATNLGGTALGGAAFGPAHSGAGTGAPLPFAAVVALLLAVAAAITVAAAATTVRRDVS